MTVGKRTAAGSMFIGVISPLRMTISLNCLLLHETHPINYASLLYLPGTLLVVDYFHLSYDVLFHISATNYSCSEVRGTAHHSLNVSNSKTEERSLQSYINDRVVGTTDLSVTTRSLPIVRVSRFVTESVRVSIENCTSVHWLLGSVL